MRRLPRALLTLLAVLTLCACGKKAQDGANGANGGEAALSWDELSFDETMPLDYATQFSVSYAGDDYKRVRRAWPRPPSPCPAACRRV